MLTSPFVLVLFLITDFADGGDLHALWTSQESFPVDHVRFYVAELVVALTYLHSCFIIYRDLKFENILVDREGHVILTDFGLSKILSPRGSKYATSVCGTVGYQAPEMFLLKKYSFSFDWFSLGIVSFEMLTGNPPYKSKQKTDSAIQRAIQGGNYEQLPGKLPESVKSFVHNLLEVNPKHRLGYKDEDVKRHDFFADIQWDTVENRRLNPPYVPGIKKFDENKNDVQHFDPHLGKNYFHQFNYPDK